jgi:hypothetical protein
VAYAVFQEAVMSTMLTRYSVDDERMNIENEDEYSINSEV